MAATYSNWLGVLKWSLAQNDGTHPSDLKPMSEEVSSSVANSISRLPRVKSANLQNKKWLTKVFNSMTVDEAGRMRELGVVLALPSIDGAIALPVATPATPDGVDEEDKHRTTADNIVLPVMTRKLAALEELMQITESIDNAKNLFVVGAFPALMGCVMGEDLGLGPAGAATPALPAPLAEVLRAQSRAADVLATVLQNNPTAQAWALQSGALHALVAALARASVETHLSCGIGVDATGDPVPLPPALHLSLAAASAAGAVAAASAGVDSEGHATASTDAHATDATLFPLRLAVHTSLLTAISALVRDSGPAQAALLVAAASAAAPTGGVPAAAAGVDGAGSAAAEADAAHERGQFRVPVPPALLDACRRGGAAAAGPAALAAAVRCLGCVNAAEVASALAAAGPVLGPTAVVSAAVSPFSCVLRALALWPHFCTTPCVPSAARGRRLVRKALFFLRHMMHGVDPDAVKTACLALHEQQAEPALEATTGGGGGGIVVPLLLQVLRVAPGGDMADSESLDARDNALHCLLELTGPSRRGVSVTDESERRKLPAAAAGVTVGGRAAVAVIPGAAAVAASAAVAPVASAAPLSAAEAADAAMAVRRAAGTVASVPTAAAVMIEHRREQERARAAAARTSDETRNTNSGPAYPARQLQQQPQLQQQAGGGQSTALVAIADAPAVAGPEACAAAPSPLLQAAGGATAADADAEQSQGGPMGQLQRVALLLQPTLGLQAALEAHMASLQARIGAAAAASAGAGSRSGEEEDGADNISPLAAEAAVTEGLLKRLATSARLLAASAAAPHPAAP